MEIEKPEAQVEWDKIKETSLIKVKTIQKKHVEQLRILNSDRYSHECHVVLGWYYLDSFDNVIIRNIEDNSLWRMPIWAYCQGHLKSCGENIRDMGNAEVLALENMVRTTFDQIFI